MQSLMVMGTTSDSGKSTIVAALCRWLHRQGVSVAPFKPQNMALNSAVTEDGGEIGRSTALQALACGIEPHSDMNPVLLKPQTDRGAQVILRGQVYGNMDAVDYHGFKKEARKSVMAAWEALKARYDVIIVEGAGSPAEINLRENDIANMGFAEAADLPVLLVGDIDRGGVFAQLAGTLQLLSQSERDRVTGLLINRFRGDPALLEDGLKWLEDYTGKPLVGVFPYLQGLILDAEDSVGLTGTEADEDALKVVVPALPRMSNHNDFDPLRLHPKVDLQFIGPDQPKPGADLIILPGSKSTRSDCEWLKAQGWHEHIQRHLRYGGKVLGICGGFQMLGKTIADPDGIEGEPGETDGLKLLDLETRLVEGKQLRRVTGVFAESGTPMSGYEIHNGVTTGSALERPLVSLDGRPDGAVSEDQAVAGCYIHGVFDGAEACDTLLVWAGLHNHQAISDYQQHRLAELDRLADAVTEHVSADLL
ncbi:cobyric acid synthase [Vreelandella utahensis]|uniref:cobyric acid synthase n=1 Tax=Vreelandella halophila TaxID=86177 RepID=UPI0009863B8F|nr:cobyric acid synthase [Halomonas utahensis]